MAGKNVMRSIYFPSETLEAAKKRADSLNMGLSAYIQFLVNNDLRTKGAFVIEPAPEKRIKKESKKKSSK